MATQNSKVSKSDEITAKSFDKYLADTVTNASTMRARIQILIAFGISKAMEERTDLSYLTRLFLAFREVRGVNAKLIQRYICATLPVYWREGDGEVPAFVKTKKGLMEVVELNCQWFEYEKAKPAAKTNPLDVNNRVTKLVDGMTDAWNTRAPVRIDTKLLREQIRKLQELADKLEAREETKS